MGSLSALALLSILGLIALACRPSTAPATPTPTASPTATAATPITTPTPAATPTPPPTSQPPSRDPIDLARRFRGLPPDAPRLARQAPLDQRVGDRQDFYLIDLDTPSLYTVSATLRLISDHAYFFVQDGIDVSQETLERAAADFEELVYPTVTAAFGREWSPGVDSDPRITILHAQLKGAGGYVSGDDEYPRAVIPHSNQREMIYLDADFLSAPRSAYNATLAHELQHLIHWRADPDEEAWVNEGLSQVAGELLGEDPAAWTQPFLRQPDTQLNHWPPDSEDPLHYAASQLFFRYLLDRFGGRERASELLAIGADGIAGVDEYLKGFGTTFQEVFADWLVANYLDQPSGPYAQQGADLRVAQVTVVREPGEGSDTVHQFAADYLRIEPPPGGGIFTFHGADEVGVGIPPHDGPFWWSGLGDGIDSRLTREFDLSGLRRATLRFWTWFDTERGWDYAYVAASSDGGRTWRALPGRHTSDFDPVGAAYGPGYTGKSGGEEGPAWVQEEVDLTPFAGGKVLLRFEYVTDDSKYGAGFALDDIEIPELAFQDGAEGEAGWLAQGFRRIEGPLQQRFLLLLIEGGEPPRVRSIPLHADNVAQLLLGEQPVTLVVAAVTPGTIQPAAYRWTLSPPP